MLIDRVLLMVQGNSWPGTFEFALDGYLEIMVLNLRFLRYFFNFGLFTMNLQLFVMVFLCDQLEMLPNTLPIFS